MYKIVLQLPFVIYIFTLTTILYLALKSRQQVNRGHYVRLSNTWQKMDRFAQDLKGQVTWKVCYISTSKLNNLSWTIDAISMKFCMRDL